MFSGPDNLMQSVLKVVDEWKESGLEIFSKKADDDLLEKLKRLQLMRFVAKIHEWCTIGVVLQNHHFEEIGCQVQWSRRAAWTKLSGEINDSRERDCTSH